MTESRNDSPPPEAPSNPRAIALAVLAAAVAASPFAITGHWDLAATVFTSVIGVSRNSKSA